MTAELIEQLNVELPYNGFVLEYSDEGGYPYAKIRLPSYDGLREATIYISSDAKHFIDNWFEKRGISIEWNNTLAVFWSHRL